ncbi:MAG: MFS transporter [Desulfonauticus sp.]|nr:MFS transporter [Desulfonauticus sp.]
MTKSQRKMYIFLFVLTVVTTLGFQGWRILINNFAVEIVKINGQEMGLLQSIREVPGFLALLVIYLLFIFTEHRLAALSVIILGIGVGLTGFFPCFLGLVFCTLLMSFGFHYYETLNQSLTLQYFDLKQAPLVMGKLKGLAALVNIITGVIVFGLAFWLNYKQMFLVLGGLTVLGGLWALVQDPSDKQLPPQHKKMILRKKYWLFYVLTLFAGARRQIFVAFAVFLLVKKFHYSILEISVLFVVNNVLNYYFSPILGKAINRFGERWILSLEYFSLIFIFLVYAFGENKWLIGIMYILDHIFFNFAIAIRSFFQKIADPKDIAPSMAVGFTINHIIAVIVPVVGGVLWMYDYRIPFIGGAIFSFISLCFVQLIKYKGE